MQNCGNDTLQKFLEDVITEVRNTDVVTSDDVTFIIAGLFQRFSKADRCSIIDFIRDLEKYSDYVIHIEKSTNEYNGICDIEVQPCVYSETDFMDYPEYHYRIEITSDERMWGYCECSPDDKDFREDKGCCGHGCDWYAPSFKLHKIIEVENYKWNGDEHDFWDFEDTFYKSESELEEQKKKSDKEYEIKQIKERMKVDEQRLKELMEN